MREGSVSEALPKGLLDKKATASMLFDDIAAAVDELVKREVNCTISVILSWLFFSDRAIPI